MGHRGGGTGAVARAGTWAVAHAVDLAVGALALGWAAYAIRIGRGFSFLSDDLQLIEQAGSLGGLFEPYNGHASMLILGMYRLLAEAAGLHFGPYLVVGVLAIVAVAVTYYLTTRDRLGPVAAAVLTLPLLLHPDAVFRPASANHYFVLVGAFLAAFALDRGPRADLLLAVAVGFSLAAAGGGLVVAATCLLHNLLTRAPLRRWVAVAVPLALWGVWWQLGADGELPTSPRRLDLGETVDLAVEMLAVPFVKAGLDDRVAAALLAVAFVAWAVTRLRGGLASGANVIAWTAAVVMWAVALGRSRGPIADAQTFRYGYLALGFVLLAVVPRRPLEHRFHLRSEAGSVLPRWALGAAAAVLVLGGLRGIAVRDDLQVFAGWHTERGRFTVGTMLAAQLGPEAVPDDMPIIVYGWGLPHGTGAELRALLDRWGGPGEGLDGEGVDRELVDRGIVAARVARGGRRPVACEPLRGPLVHPGTLIPGLGVVQRNMPQAALQEGPLWLRTAEPVTIEVRRFGEEWVRVRRVDAERRVRLLLPSLDAEVPWEVRIDGGACLEEQAAPASR